MSSQECQLHSESSEGSVQEAFGVSGPTVSPVSSSMELAEPSIIFWQAQSAAAAAPIKSVQSARHWNILAMLSPPLFEADNL